MGGGALTSNSMTPRESRDKPRAMSKQSDACKHKSRMTEVILMERVNDQFRRRHPFKCKGKDSRQRLLPDLAADIKNGLAGP